MGFRITSKRGTEKRKPGKGKAVGQMISNKGLKEKLLSARPRDAVKINKILATRK